MTRFDEAKREGWAGVAEAYADSFAKVCAHTVPRLLDAASIEAGTRVLDVGTGTGTAARAACERGAQVVAVDAEPGMLALAAEQAPSAEMHLAALPDLPFPDDEFDAVVANFVVNHVGRPRAALAELRRVTRPGGRIAVTLWTAPSAAGQALLGRAVQETGLSRPDHLPALDPAEDFPRTEQGLAGLLAEAGLADTVCDALAWNHRTTPDEWWSGAAAGVATIGQIVTSQGPEAIVETRRHFDRLCLDFLDAEGTLVLPHAALLASGRA